jgi:hypothetical protein
MKLDRDDWGDLVKSLVGWTIVVGVVLYNLWGARANR